MHISKDFSATSFLGSSANKFRITICNKLLWVGCEGHTPEHWLENYKEIAEENNVSEDDIKWYLDFYETKLKNLI